MSSSVSMQEDLWEYRWVSPAIQSHDWRDASYVLLAEAMTMRKAKRSIVS